MPNSRHKIKTHIRSSWSCSFACFVLCHNIRRSFYCIFLHYFIHTCIARFISQFRHSLRRQFLVGSYHGFHRESHMLIISQTPMQFIPEYIEQVRAVSQKQGRLFDHELCVIFARRILYRSHLELLVRSGYLVGTVWNIRKEKVLWDIQWYCFLYISADWRTFTSNNNEVLGSLL